MITFKKFIKRNMPIFTYDIRQAKNYAEQFWATKNSKYPYFEENDCINFVSQILVAGGVSMTKPASNIKKGVNLLHTNYWYSTSDSINFSCSSSFTSIRQFNNYWSKYVQTYICQNIAEAINVADTGDVILMQQDDLPYYAHAVFVFSKEHNTLKLSSHTKNYLDKDITTLDRYLEFKIFKFSIH